MTPSNDQENKVAEESAEEDANSEIEEMEEIIEEDDAPLSPVDFPCTPSLFERVMITALTTFVSMLTYFLQASPPQTPESPEGEYLEEEEEEKTGDDESLQPPEEHLHRSSTPFQKVF